MRRHMGTENAHYGKIKGQDVATLEFKIDPILKIDTTFHLCGGFF